MASIKPYSISITQEKLDRLRQKLALTDFPDQFQGQDEWTYGSPLTDIKNLVSYWQERYDWRKQEQLLNRLPNFQTSVPVTGFGTFDIHFLHQKSNIHQAIPLLFIHGWPGSFIEVSKIIYELTKGDQAMPAFHVVAPSLVNFGFSTGCSRPGFSLDQQAEMCLHLMQILGYDKFVVQGGDIGAFVARILAQHYPENVKATHINMVLARQPTLALNPALFAQMQATPLTASEQAGLARSQWFNKVGNAYYQLQSTKPQTIGYSMLDSPVGLLAWIYEKLHDWTDDYPWTEDEVLTWVSIYYFSTAGPYASQRLYYEMTHPTPEGHPNPPPLGNGEKGALERHSDYCAVKLGVMRMPKELVQMPKLWARTFGPVVFESEYEKGGHFASWERPDAVVKDLRDMFGKGGGAEGAVEGKSGYD